MMVADGMGGAAAGEIASAMAAEVIFNHMKEHWLDRPGAARPSGSPSG